VSLTTGTLIRWLLLLVAAVPVIRVMLKRPVRDEVEARPWLALVMVAGAGAALALVRWSESLSERARWIVPVAAALCAVMCFLRARPGYGARRKLPPGSLSLATSLDAIAQEDFYASAARQFGPVFKMAQFHRPVVCLVDLPIGLAVLTTQAQRLAPPSLPFGRLSPGNYIEFMHDEQHARYRGILRTALSGRVVAECRDGVAVVMREQVRAMMARDQGQGVDPQDFLARIAVVSMLRVMFGIPIDDARLNKMQQLFNALGSPRAFAERRPEERVATFGRLTRCFHEVGDAILIQLQNGDPPARSVLSEILRADPAHLDDEILLGNLVLMVHVTRSNVHGLLGWILKEYFDHPGTALLLREAARPGTAGRSRVEALATNFVNETLRMHQSEYFYREVIEELSIGGFRIPKGWLLRVCVRECHDNAAVFPDPKVFRPERFDGRQYEKSEYCPFSDGTHSCFGAGLAVMIARTLVVVLALDFDGRTVSDGPVERAGNRHWSHWRPSRTFRVALAPHDSAPAISS
jgi:cytochrome P450